MEVIKVNRGYQFKIEPNEEQKEFFLQCFGCVRKIYNHYVDALYTHLEAKGYENGYIPNIRVDSPASMKKEYPYMKDADSLALCNAQIHFRDAVNRFNEKSDRKSYTKRSLKHKRTLGIEPTFRDLKGMPRFKSRKDSDFAYTTNNQPGKDNDWRSITLKDGILDLPKVKGIKVKQHRPLPDGAIIKNATVKMNARGRFHVSLCVEYTIKVKRQPSVKLLGLDYSQTDFYVDSEGRKANYPHYYRKTEEKLKQEQRKLSRKVKGSAGWEKQRLKVSRLQERIANQRRDWLHKKSLYIAENYDAVMVEDIDLRAMGQCLKLAKNLQDNGFGMFREFLAYKLEERGKQFIKVDKWFASSKTCHVCGHVYDLTLKERTWTCPECKTYHDRDVNAAINIKEAGTALLAW